MTTRIPRTASRANGAEFGLESQLCHAAEWLCNNTDVSELLHDDKRVMYCAVNSIQTTWQRQGSAS